MRRNKLAQKAPPEAGIPTQPRNKYGTKPTWVDNIRFQSGREARVYITLRSLLRGKAIEDLHLQKRFELVVNGQKICEYVADFFYWDPKRRQRFVIDAKGCRTPEYKLKKKLFEAIYPFKIEEM